MKFYIKIFILIGIIFFAKTIFASVEITEIMYDVSGTDTNREWIEVYNNGPDPVDISQWYLFSDSTKHALNPVASATVPPMSYVVIAQNVDKFRIDQPSFSGLIYDSSWTGFSNEGDSLSLKDPDLNVVSPVTYTSSMGADGDGNSLQKVNGTFIPLVPTPGTKNTNNTNTPTDEPNTQEEQPAKAPVTGSSKSKETVAETQKFITTKIIARNKVATRVGFPIDSITIGYKKEKLDSGKFVWSFGDGMSSQVSRSLPFEYSYKYAGEYVLTLNYYESILSSKPSATDSVTISVVDPELFISQVGNNTDPFVEIKNQSEDKMSLSGWVLNSNTKSFKLPEGMAILPNKSVRLSPQITFFDATDIQHLSLYAPNATLVSTYPISKIQISQTIENNYKNKNYTNTIQKIDKNNEIDLNDITASAGSSKIESNNLPLIGLVFLIIVGVGALVFTYKKPTSVEMGEISASDIKIIE